MLWFLLAEPWKLSERDTYCIMSVIENMTYNNINCTENQSSNKVLYIEQKLCLCSHLMKIGLPMSKLIRICLSDFASQSSVLMQCSILNSVCHDGHVKLYYLRPSFIKSLQMFSFIWWKQENSRRRRYIRKCLTIFI